MGLSYLSGAVSVPSLFLTTIRTLPNTFITYPLIVLFDRTSVDIIPNKVVDSQRFCKSVLNRMGKHLGAVNKPCNWQIQQV